MSNSARSDPRRVTVIVPVKGLQTAKSRTQLPSAAREGLALDLMTRTVTAALRATCVARVIVVAGDTTIADTARALGALALREGGSLGSDALAPEAVGLNGAIAAGRDHAQRVFPEDDIAIVVGDLAELHSEDLEAVVSEYHRIGAPLLVADHLGTGTTMLVHPREASPPLLFGPDSAARHQAADYTAFAAAPPGARRDVDIPADVESFGSPVP